MVHSGDSDWFITATGLLSLGLHQMYNSVLGECVILPKSRESFIKTSAFVAS